MDSIDSLQLNELLIEVEQRKPKLVLLQMPEGLKNNVTKIEDTFAREKIETITILDPSYGACDIADEKAKLLGCDLLIHFGHSKMLHAGIPVIYWPITFPLQKEMIPGMITALKKEKFFQENKKIGIYVTIQFHPHVEKIKKELEKEGYSIFIGKGDLKDGQILGCDVSARKEIESLVDANVYFGDGHFHALAIAFASGKPTYQYDPFAHKLEDLEKYKEKFLRQRYGLIAKAKDAKTFAIILCTKKGQLRKALALKVKKDLEDAGKKVFLVSMEYVNPTALMGVNVDAYVNTACSRIATDDWANYAKPMLTPIDVEVLLQKRKPQNYVFDEIKHLGNKVM